MFKAELDTKLQTKTNEVFFTGHPVYALNLNTYFENHLEIRQGVWEGNSHISVLLSERTSPDANFRGHEFNYSYS